MNDTPRIEVTVAAPVETVWSLLRDPDLIRRWHGWEFDGLAEEIRTIYLNGVTADPDAHTLEFSDGDVFTLHQAPGGTVVRVTRAPHDPDSDWADYYDDITEGWWTFLQQMRFAVERHGLAERRTLFLDGRITDAQPPAGAGRRAELRGPGLPLVDAAGLGDAAVLPVGAAYRASAATGDTLAGTVWARGPRQLLLTVDGWGDGLLVLAEQPVSPHRPNGGAMAALTTYGQDDDAYAGLASRWTAWFEKTTERTEPLP